MLRSLSLALPVWIAVFSVCATHVDAQRPTNAGTLKQQAEAAYHKREFSKAIELTNQALVATANDHEALYVRGSSRIELGIEAKDTQMVRDGIADTREAIRFEGNGKPEYYFPYIYGMSHLTELEGKNNHAESALTVADSVLERQDLTGDQRANLHYQRAQAHSQLGKFPEAEADLNKAIQISPSHLASHMLLAEFAAKTGDADSASAAYTRVVQQFPTNPVVFNNRGMFYQSVGRAADAINDFNKAIQLDNQFIPAYINRGYAYLEAGDSVNAEAALNQALNVDPNQSGAISLRATARLNQNKAQEALADYRKVVEMSPKSPLAHADFGFAQFFTGNYQGALNSFNTAISLSNQTRFLFPWKLACEIRLNSVDQPSYQSMLTKPEEKQDWVDKLVLFQFGKLDATNLLKSASASDPSGREAQYCEGYYFIGMELQRRGRVQDAIAYWKQAANRKNPKLSAYRGAVYAIGNANNTTTR
ncbi:MAG: tetratricopeptide repeat protein [Planctomycetaceae bacterium]|nr:tetratricopeptide repeat protein [Planctomycetaceae bacterium]